MIQISSNSPPGSVPIEQSEPIAPAGTAAHTDAAAMIGGDADPIAKFGALYGFHAGVRQYGTGASLGSKPGTMQYIGGANPPRLEQGKGRGPDVTDLQRQINVWRENRWRAEGNPGGSDAAGRVLDHLKPGESAVLRLSGDPSGNHADHFITVGILKDGRPFIYKPDLARGDATLTVGRALGDQPAEFSDELAKYSQRATRSAGDHATATKVSY